jgi:hypothetical protein
MEREIEDGQEGGMKKTGLPDVEMSVLKKLTQSLVR